MERCGCKGWWILTVRMRCASWTRAHAAEYVSAIGEAVRAAGGRLPTTWLEGLLHRLKHQGPQRVLTHLAWLTARYPSPLVQEKLSYLQKREAQMQYPAYQAAGWPIGSGSVESAGHPWSSKHVSKEQACAGVQRTSIPCWGYATRSAIGSGPRRGRHRQLIDERFAQVGGKQRATSG